MTIDTIIANSPIFYFTQTLWRDEVFSIFVARKPILSFIGNLSFEPPFYYILLHLWMRIFGTGELATRSLSFIAFMLACILVILFAERRFGKHWMTWYMPVFFFLNPMLLYYAFEVRTYGWYIFFATASFIAYLEKKWAWYVSATVLGFYTHAYMLIVPFVQALHYLFFHWRQLTKSIPTFIGDPMVRAMGLVAVLIGPWFFIILQEAGKLKHSWYFPVDYHLIRSVLGNMFVGYEGTPWYGWPFTALLSKVIFVLSIIALLNPKKRDQNTFYTMMMIVPLVLVIGISFIKPLFVNRYLIPVTIAQVFLIVSALESIRYRLFQKILAAIMILFVVTVNIWYPQKHPKTPSRAAMAQINALWDNDDIVLATSPIVLFEAQYYSADASRVFLYNPSGSAFPWYVGDMVVDESQIVSTIPRYPVRAFLLHDNATFSVTYRTIPSDAINVQSDLKDQSL